MFGFRSTLGRILLLHGVALLAVSAILPLTLYELISHTARDLHDQLMNQQARLIADFLEPLPSATGEVTAGWNLKLPVQLRTQYSNAYGRSRFAILDAKGNVLFASLAGRPIFPLPGSRSVEYSEKDDGLAKLQGVSLPIDKGDTQLWVQVAEDLAHPEVLIDDVVTLFLPRVGWVVLPFLLILLVLDVIIFRRALRPIEIASEQAARITPRTVSTRLDLTKIPSEIRPLVIAVNAALERLEIGFRQQRDFAADAAHELRTPIAVLRVRLATLPQSPGTDALVRDIESMSRVVTQLLQIAELDSAEIGDDERADLREISQEVVEMLAPLAISAGKEIGLIGAEEPVWVKGNAEMIFRAIRNLAENGLSHTPAGTAVDVEVRIDGQLSVLDQGPGIPESERDLVVRRFWRRDRARNGSSGLGLAIVHRIAELHDATMLIADNQPNGARITLAFYRAGAGEKASGTAAV